MENTPSSTKVAFKWSLICVVVAIVITYTFQFLNIDQNSGIKYVGFVPFIAFLLLAQKDRYCDILINASYQAAYPN